MAIEQVRYSKLRRHHKRNASTNTLIHQSIDLFANPKRQKCIYVKQYYIHLYSP